MADRPNQPPRDTEFSPEELGETRESREPAGLGDVVPGETREPAVREPRFGEPGVGVPAFPETTQEPTGTPLERPGSEQREPGGVPGGWVEEPLSPMRGREEPATGDERFGLGGEAEAGTVAGAPETGEPIEPKGAGEGVVDSLKSAFRKVKDAVTPDDEARDEEARRGPLPQEPQEGQRGPLPQEPEEGRGGLR